LLQLLSSCSLPQTHLLLVSVCWPCWSCFCPCSAPSAVFFLLVFRTFSRALVANGVSCARGSFVHAPYCRFHLRAVLGLDVDESTIADAGLGLFSLVARPKGFHLVDYLGEVVSKSQIEKRYPKNTLGAYSLKLSSSLFIDSALSRGVGACANAPGKGIRPLSLTLAAKVLVWRWLARRSSFLTVEVIGGRRTHPTSLSMFLTGSGIFPIRSLRPHCRPL